MRWVAHYLIEIENGIEVTRSANPLIDGLPISFAGRAGVVIIRAHIGCNRCADHANAACVGANDELLISSQNTMYERSMLHGSQFTIAREVTKVIDSLKHNQPMHAILGQHVAIEARQCVWAEAVC